MRDRADPRPEAWVSPHASDFTDALAEKPPNPVFQYPLTAVRDCAGDARENAHNASTLAGDGLHKCGLGLNHAIAHQLGGQFIFRIPANALLLTTVIRFNAGVPQPNATRMAKSPRLCPAEIMTLRQSMR